QTAEADLQIHEAELAQGCATVTAAQTRFRQPVHLEAAWAEAAATLAKTETERGNLPFQLRAAETRLRLARLDLESKTAIGERGGPRPASAPRDRHSPAAERTGDRQRPAGRASPDARRPAGEAGDGP